MFTKAQEKSPSIDNGSIKEQFDYIFKKSSNYENYKVVKRVWLQKLQKHITDSLQAEQQRYIKANNEIQAHKKSINTLQTELDAIKKDLANVNDAKDSIALFRMPIQKKMYKTIVWSLIAVLLIILGYFIYSFNNSNSITKKTIAKYDDLEHEYNSYRTRALEREQVLNRKLQDEINKQKKS